MARCVELSEVRKDVVKQYCDLLQSAQELGFSKETESLRESYLELANTFNDSERYYAALELQHRKRGGPVADMAFKINVIKHGKYIK